MDNILSDLIERSSAFIHRPTFIQASASLDDTLRGGQKLSCYGDPFAATVWHYWLSVLNESKCNLGKVKIKSMQ